MTRKKSYQGVGWEVITSETWTVFFEWSYGNGWVEVLRRQILAFCGFKDLKVRYFGPLRGAKAEALAKMVEDAAGTLGWGEGAIWRRRMNPLRGRAAAVEVEGAGCNRRPELLWALNSTFRVCLDAAPQHASASRSTFGTDG